MYQLKSQWFRINVRTMRNKNLKPIPGYSNYSATPDGRLWTHNLRPGWMTPHVDRNGYIRFHMLGDNGKRKGVYIHQIVALTYIPNPNKKPHVNHKDFNKANNSVENLQWCTHLENIRHDWANGRRRKLKGEEIGGAKNTEKTVLEIRRLHKQGTTGQALARQFGISQPTVSQIILEKTWRHLL